MQDQYLTTQIGILSDALKNLQASVNELSVRDTTGDATGGGGITNCDQYVLQANQSSTGIVTNWGDLTGTLVTTLGTRMSHSSGVFTFPATGKWRIDFNALFQGPSSGGLRIQSTDDNFSTGDTIAIIETDPDPADYGIDTNTQSVLVQISDTTNDKIRFRLSLMNSGALKGDANQAETNVIFTKLSD